MECNKLIKKILTTNVNCTENLFGVFSLFANGIMTFDDVLNTAKQDNIDFKALCENCDVDFNKIANRDWIKRKNEVW